MPGGQAPAGQHASRSGRQLAEPVKADERLTVTAVTGGAIVVAAVARLLRERP